MLNEKQNKKSYIEKIKEELINSKDKALFEEIINHYKKANNLDSLIWILKNALNIPPTTLHQIVDIIISSNNYDKIFECAKLIDGRPNNKGMIRNLALAIIKSNSYELISNFLILIEDAPVSLLIDGYINVSNLEQLLESNDLALPDYAESIYRLAKLLDCKRKEVSKKKLVETVIKTNCVLIIIKYAATISDAPINKLADAIIRIGYSHYIYKFALCVNGAPVERLTDALVNLSYQTNKFNVYDVYEFAKNVPNAPVKKLAQLIINVRIKQDPNEYKRVLYLFACDVKDAPIEQILDEFISLKAWDYLIAFARDIEGAPIEKITDAILTIPQIQPCIVYTFASRVPNVNLEKITNYFVRLGNLRYLYLISATIPEFNVESIVSVVLTLIKSQNNISIEELEILRKFCNLSSKLSVQTIRRLEEIVGNSIISPNAQEAISDQLISENESKRISLTLPNQSK